LALCRALLGIEEAPVPVAPEPATEPKATIEGDPAASVCPSCGEGRMEIVASFRAIPVHRREWGLILESAEFDTS
jgi:hypothetical protein